MSLTLEYFLFVLAAAMGFIQFAAGRGGLRGLLFSQNPRFNRALAVSLALPPMVAFFTWNYRNPVGIIEGAQQAGMFSLAVLAAMSLTMIMGSVFNHRRLSSDAKSTSCMEDLKNMTFFQAFRKRYLWKR